MERRDKRAKIELDRMTLAMNSGLLITYDRDALRRWQRAHRPVGQTQAPSEFTGTVNRLARMFPNKVKTH